MAMPGHHTDKIWGIFFLLLFKTKASIDLTQGFWIFEDVPIVFSDHFKGIFPLATIKYNYYQKSPKT